MKLPPLSDLAQELQARAAELKRRWQSVRGTPALTLIRPSLPLGPGLTRRLAEPIVLVVSVLSLLALMALGITGVALLVLAASMTYAILTFVFGLKLDIDPLA